MARTPQIIIIPLLISSFTILLVQGKDESFVKSLNPKILGLKKEKLSHFRLFWHDIFSGKNPSAVTVVKPINTSSTFFGAINMIDDPLTEGPELSSKLLGRAQGFYALADQHDFGLLMAMNFHFVEGKYNGSTITVMGRNQVLTKVREMSVIGGSGHFRFARGYAQLSTHTANFTTGDACVEYNVYVLHY